MVSQYGKLTSSSSTVSNNRYILDSTQGEELYLKGTLEYFVSNTPYQKHEYNLELWLTLTEFFNRLIF